MANLNLLKGSQSDTVIIEGYLVNADGEIIGAVDQKPEFTVDSVDAAEWVLEKLSAHEGTMLGLEARKAALIANLDAQIAEERRRAEWLRTRFGSEIETFARAELEGKKTKTLKLTYGQISFRIVKGGVRVEDKDKALTWGKEYQPEAIKVVEEFQVSKLSDGDREDLRNVLENTDFTDPDLSSFERGAYHAFRVDPDRESVSIKTGVGA